MRPCESKVLGNDEKPLHQWLLLLLCFPSEKIIELVQICGLCFATSLGEQCLSIYFKETLEISKCCRKASGIWICQGEERGLEGNSWGDSHQSSSAAGPDGCREGVAKCLWESRDQEKQRELKKKITSCQTNWVKFVTELVTEQRWESTFRGKSKRFRDHGDSARSDKSHFGLLASFGR